MIAAVRTLTDHASQFWFIHSQSDPGRIRRGDGEDCPILIDSTSRHRSPSWSANRLRRKPLDLASFAGGANFQHRRLEADWHP